jgi:type II secretory pathway pseudopilin PulG
MMVVVVILGLIVLGLVTFFTGGAKSWVAGQSQLEAQRNARQAMDRMVKKIREGENVKLGSTGTTITVIYTDSSEKEYRKDSYTLREDNLPLIDNLIDKSYTTYPIFKYYNETGVVTPDGNNVSKVHIELEVDIDKDGNPDITLNADVSLRNFGL